MNRKLMAVVGIAAAATLAVAGCSKSSGSSHVELTLSSWSLAQTPEFQKLADGFHALHPDVTITLKEYDANNYDTLLQADLAAQSAPDILTQKNFKNYYQYATGGALLDISDVVAGLPDTTNGKAAFAIDGKSYGVPYRQDAWVLYYNKDLFDKAGVAYPDGSWTWDDYAAAAKALTTGLKAKNSTATGAYEHSWQSTIQGFANAQTPGADITSGNYEYLKPWYQRALDLQSAGAQPDLGTVTTNKLTYQAEFGKQQAAMMPMGTWYVATILAQQKTGDADTFNWGMAPVPQYDNTTTGLDKTPVTFGDPTGLAINAGISNDKVATAKEFLTWAAGPDAAKILAGIGITPANTADVVVQTYFAQAGVPGDDLSKFAWAKHDTKPENPVSKYTVGVQNLLNALHTAVLSGSEGIDAAITDAQNQAKATVLNQ
ncbi:MAG TPA: extracellular solute-binding protein [Micromonosporaceae bacterium]|jgi:multiple sugar transport system substrate-binding protein